MTEIVVAPFDDRRLEGASGSRRDCRNELASELDIIALQLLLEIDGVRADQDGVARLERPERGGNEVGQGFSRTGPGFNDQVVSVLKRFSDVARHFELLGALFESVCFHRRECLRGQVRQRSVGQIDGLQRTRMRPVRWRSIRSGFRCLEHPVA